MIVELPEWQPYVPGENPWTPEITNGGRMVVALAPVPASREQWSAEIVFDLLEAWSQSGHRVVLADYVLEHPMLHRKAGMANEEGLVDAALFGASVSRIARPVPGRSFFFVGTGSPAGDPAAVLSAPRLGRLQDGFREAGVTFVAFVRQGCVGAAALVEAADDLLVLADAATELPDGMHGSAAKVRAVVGPASDEGVPTAAISAEPNPAPDLDLEVTEVELPPPTDAPPSQPADAFEWAESWQDEAEPAHEESNDTGAGSEAEMDFSAPAEADDVGDHPGDDETVAAQAEPAPVAPTPSRQTRRGADPNARRKLIWVLLAVLVLVVLVVLGALG